MFTTPRTSESTKAMEQIYVYFIWLCGHKCILLGNIPRITLIRKPPPRHEWQIFHMLISEEYDEVISSYVIGVNFAPVPNYNFLFFVDWS